MKNKITKSTNKSYYKATLYLKKDLMDKVRSLKIIKDGEKDLSDIVSECIEKYMKGA